MADASGAGQGIGTAIVAAVGLSYGLSNGAQAPVIHLHVRAPPGRTVKVKKG